MSSHSETRAAASAAAYAGEARRFLAVVTLATKVDVHRALMASSVLPADFDMEANPS